MSHTARTRLPCVIHSPETSVDKRSNMINRTFGHLHPRQQGAFCRKIQHLPLRHRLVGLHTKRTQCPRHRNGRNLRPLRDRHRRRRPRDNYQSPRILPFWVTAHLVRELGSCISILRRAPHRIDNHHNHTKEGYTCDQQIRQ